MLLAWTSSLETACLVLALTSVPDVLLRRRGRPVSALAWLLVLVTFPPLGLLLWWLIGHSHLERKRRRRRRAAKKFATQLTAFKAGHPLSDDLAARVLDFKRLPPELDEGVFPPTTGNRTRLLVDGPMVFEAFEAAIKGARHHVHLLFYIWQNDAAGRELRDLLLEKSRQGVQIRILYDSLGSRGARHQLLNPLRGPFCEVAGFLPPRLWTRRPSLNFRNHRKILVVDGEIGFMGGLNIGNEYKTTWHDLAVEITGPAVHQLQEVFVDDWYYATSRELVAEAFFPFPAITSSQPSACAVIASGPDTAHNMTHDALFMAINQATTRLWMTTPYFIPTSAIMAALRSAAFRGVDVRVLVPAKSDLPFVRRAARSYYTELLSFGARLYEYQPRVLHAKAALFDHHLALLGSANLDTRSFRLNFEVSCYCGGPSMNAALAELFERDLAQSRELSLESLAALSWSVRVLDAAANLVSPLL